MKRGLIIIHEIHPKQGSECRSGYNYFKKIITYCDNNKQIKIDVIIPKTNLFGTSNYYFDLINDLIRIPNNLNIIVINHVKIPYLSNYLFFLQKKKWWFR